MFAWSCEPLYTVYRLYTVYTMKQTSSKCIQICTCTTCTLIASCLLHLCLTFARCLLDVCSTFAWCLLYRVNGVLEYHDDDERADEVCKKNGGTGSSFPAKRPPSANRPTHQPTAGSAAVKQPAPRKRTIMSESMREKVDRFLDDLDDSPVSSSLLHVTHIGVIYRV